jgi:hypothetical protein
MRILIIDPQSPVIVHDFYVPSVAVVPHETNPPLVIDSDAPLAVAIPRELFQAVSRWDSQILYASSLVQLCELASSYSQQIYAEATHPKA